MINLHCPLYPLDRIFGAISGQNGPGPTPLFCFSIVLVISIINANEAPMATYETSVWTAQRSHSLFNSDYSSRVNTLTTTPATTSATVTPASVRNNSNQTAFEHPTVGYWLNLGVPYYKCPNSYEVDRCKNLPSTKPTPENSVIWKPDYAMLVDQITCVIQKLNCPSDNRSFQLHDIPCQSACLSVVAACQRHLPHTGCQPQYTLNSRNMWPIGSGRYLNQIGASQSYIYPYGSNLFSPPYTRYTSAFGARLHRRMGREPHGSRFVYSRPSSQAYQPSRNNVPYGQPQQPWSQHRVRRNVPVNRADYLPAGNPYGSITKTSLSEADCYLLPSGGCDKWSSQLVETDQYASASMEHNVRINPGCPADLPTLCNAMFPREYTRKQWVKGEFTVAAVIRIAQTLWWFGPNNRFQPFFRFHVTETLDSDIHPYDDKMILTYSWPSRCICPNEITADKTYLMLTHSVKSRQTLNITSSTVFLSRVKRYTRRLSCWKGSCIRRGHRNRRRRYPSGIWRWNP